DNANHYYNASGTSIATPPTTITTGITYSWSLEGIDETYATVNSSTGVVSYNTLITTSSQTATLKCTAIYTTTGETEVATYEITFRNPKFLSAPVISISDAGLVTITNPNSVGNIHYTTDGSTPTASSATYNSPFTVTNMGTVKAIITGGEEYVASDVASEQYKVESGVSGGVVTLNDYEDHTWTYYAGVDTDKDDADKVDGGNYNTNYLGKLYSPNPRNVKITYKAVNNVPNSTTDVKVSAKTGEDQTSFIYYKTLEEGSVSTQYPYQVISNPFSVRPSTGTGGSKVFYGFAGWKIVSGGEYINGYSNGQTLPLDANITFVDLPYPSVNCTSAEIVFETTWTQAIVKRGGKNVSSTDFKDGTYETNFCVINANCNALSPTYPVTITGVEPDGSTSYTNTIGGAVTPADNTATGKGSYMTKLEYVTWNPGNAIDTYGRNFIIGRGVTMTGTIRDLYGTNQTGVVNQVLKIESGAYSQYIGYNNRPSSILKQHVTFGNDYDRANNNNDNLNFSGVMRLIKAQQNNLRDATNNELSIMVIKSGRFTTTAYRPTTASSSSYCLYLWDAGTNNAEKGYRRLEIEGGILGHIGGGMDKSNSTGINLDIRMKGGTVQGCIFGGGATYNSNGDKRFIFTGGTVQGWIVGGANGFVTSGNGIVSGTTYIYAGGKFSLNSNGNNQRIDAASGGNLYGAGCGYSSSSTVTLGQVSNGTNVVVADDVFIERGVYGGGAYGYTEATSTIYITGGTIAGNSESTDDIQGGVYGGARQNKGGSAKIYMTGGLVETGIYGGSNSSGTLSGSVTMQINGGQVGTTEKTANIHGGGYGQNTIVTKDVDITLGKTNSARDAEGVVVYGDVYGGSALGSVNGTAATTTYHTNVTMNAGYIHGSLYGGALGSNSVAANVYGPVAVKVYGGSVMKTDENGANGSGAVYGANNINGAPQSSVTVDIYGTNSAPSEGEYALFSVFGGGNNANYTYGNGYPTVTVHNCDNSIEYVYGGGNAAAVAATDVTIWGGNKIGNVFGGGNGQVKEANVTPGGTSVKIYGGTIGDVYGGSNTNGTIGGTISVNVNAQAEGASAACPIDIDNVYGGGNKAASNVGEITIGCAEHIGAVYGGANQANVTGDIDLKIVSGHIDNVFGGNNNSGTISGTVKVTVDDNGSACGMEIGNVFGGGNLATLSQGPTVEILNGHITGNVFGGGKGDANDRTKGQVTGNPNVTIGTTTTGKTVTIDGDVYGGGDAGNVVGTTNVNVINKCNTVIGNVYGGGNAADVTNTAVAINGGTIGIWTGEEGSKVLTSGTGMVFGGGHGDKTASVGANIKKNGGEGGNVALTVTGGTIDKVFAGSNSMGNIEGDVNFTIEKATTSCPMHITEVYGGGNEAAGNAGTINVICTGGEGEGIGTLYGGANAADINNSINLNISGGRIGTVFGGNNTSGSIAGTITVTVNQNEATAACNNELGSIYGAGNIASYTGNPTVNIENGLIKGSVFGGGYGKQAVVIGNSTVNIGKWGEYAVDITGNVFGGGDLAAVEGDPTVTIRNCGTIIEGDLYGGGNAAPVYSTNTTVWGGTIKGNVFGGGNGVNLNPTTGNPNGAQIGYDRDDNEDSEASGDAVLNVYGGTIGTWNTEETECTSGGGIFGGSNTKGNIKGKVKLTLDGRKCGEEGAEQCSLKIKEVYGSGNQAAFVGEGITFNLGCVEALTEIYGGAKAADMGSPDKHADIHLIISSGHFNKVFGGNNLGGCINGKIKVSIDETGCNPVIIDELYCGGNQAAYSVYGYDSDKNPITTGTPKYENPILEVISCTHIGKVFGGGYGSTAKMVGTTNVIIDEIPGMLCEEDAAKPYLNTDKLGSIGEVFGGGNAADVVGNTNVMIGTQGTNHHIEKEGAEIDTDPKPSGVNISGNVYGGGNQADVTGKTNVVIGKAPTTAH
ncbi:MAG: FN3 associated domain-containing protein, partial [Prevotellaceae bacterium]|nr:FN3 associated domain-containing protein [Prevotellaceae bacterium]